MSRCVLMGLLALLCGPSLLAIIILVQSVRRGKMADLRGGGS